MKTLLAIIITLWATSVATSDPRFTIIRVNKDRVVLEMLGSSDETTPVTHMVGVLGPGEEALRIGFKDLCGHADGPNRCMHEPDKATVQEASSLNVPLYHLDEDEPGHQHLCCRDAASLKVDIKAARIKRLKLGLIESRKKLDAINGLLADMPDDPEILAQKTAATEEIAKAKADIVALQAP